MLLNKITIKIIKLKKIMNNESELYIYV